ncbi:MAG: BREX-1 system adenine-specific DNA-methyltransferase PglX [Oscillospiraceae bacterium]|nr:BREX-1 system adenine-specific DNA-methyltransferase PglX [Oscillospiraceae bacterium]
MNKTALKNFAVWARKKLISDITDSAGFLAVTENGIGEPLPQSTKDLQLFDIGTKDYVEVKGIRISQRNSLVSAIRAKTAELNGNHKAAFEYIVEEVAYTWFNRMIAIRFMEVNDYLPIRVLSSESGKHEPDIVTSPFDAELDFTNEESDLIYKLRDSNKLEDLFRMLFIKQCNKLHEVLPELFEATNDYTELLLSLSFTDKDGVVYHLVNDISEDDFDISEQGQVEIIGWMYQYYNTEPKDKVFEGLKKNVKITKENIPAATQLFTPDWIVRYMIENSLGRLWTEGHPDSSLREEWKYYLEEAQQEPEVQAQLDEIRKEYKNLSPEDIKVIDPCMGSGHILVYAFDVLMQIYAEQGYTERDAAKLIVEKNLWGLDIDKRAYQLAYFAVMMKARQYNRRILTSGVKPNLFVIDDSRALTPDIIAYIADGDKKIAADLCSIKSDFDNAREYGSIINVSPVDSDGLLVRLGEVAESDELNIIAMENKRVVVEKITPLVRQAQALAQKYDVVCTNPPYMGGSGMSAKLSDFVKTNYPDSKSDLFAVFIEKCGQMAHENGYQAMITQHAWMFLSSYEKLRKKLMFCISVNMAHLGARAFDEIGGEVVQTTAFVERKAQICGYKGTYSRLVDIVGENEKRDMFLTHTKESVSCQDNFSKIPGAPVAYWVSEKFIDIFENPSLADLAYPKTGFTTGNNDDFLRLWFEVDNVKIQKKWFYLNKGGEYRKWYGNNEYVVDWENNGMRIKQNKGSTIRNPDFYFREGITWSKISSYKFSGRYSSQSHIFDAVGLTCFVDGRISLNFVLAYFCSNVATEILKILNPTLSFTTGAIANLPIANYRKYENEIDKLVPENIELSKSDWDSFETSWDFTEHPLVRLSKDLWDATATGAAMQAYYGEHIKVSCPVELCYMLWQGECNRRFNQLKSNEEELNRIFIDIYGLQDELTPEVEEKDVTVRRADLTRDIKSLISYAVGCMFGRYSLDVDGLAYAGGEWDDSKYRTFIPDDDNCIPITDEEYFKDDIVVRFVEFIRTVYGADTIEQNLNYIADALGTKGNTSRERIRNYFLGDFIKDHIKTYQKRPIYWLFDSGKQNGFKALVYMHRWNADTTGNVRVEYLHKLQRMYENEIRQAQDVVDDGGSAREVSAAQKRIEKLTKQLKETRDYDEKIAHLAVSRIDIDLDDGVKVNYEKVQTGVDGKKIDILTKF